MSGGGGGLSKLGTALTVIFTISLLALFAELLYVLWRRRLFRRRANSPTAAATDSSSSAYSPSSSESLFSVAASSKELLYFFCIRPSPQFRLPQTSSDAASGANSGADSNSGNQQAEVEVIDIDLYKIQGMFGPPRFLFTIKEEEREDVESPMKSKEAAKEKVSLEERFKEDEAVEAVVVEIDDGGGGGGEVDDATPFSTPCASPAYFTPAASPVREAVVGRLPPEGFLIRETAPFGRSADV